MGLVEVLEEEGMEGDNGGYWIGSGGSGGSGRMGFRPSPVVRDGGITAKAWLIGNHLDCIGTCVRELLTFLHET